MKCGKSLLMTLLVTPSALFADNKTFFERAVTYSIETTKGTPILPSVQIAQSIEESGWGRSKNAIDNGNYFGLRRRKNAQSPYVYESFSNMRESFKAYVKRLHEPQYREVLRQKTYKAFVKALWKAGYCPDPQYPTRIIKIIETYNLTRFDVKRFEVSKQYSFTLKSILCLS